MVHDRFAAHLATAVGAVDDFGAVLQADLPFINDISSYTGVLVESDLSVLTVNDYVRHVLVDDEPFLKIPFAPVQMGLFAGIQALLFQLLPYLATRDTTRESLHHLDYAQVDFTGFASVSHGIYATPLQYQIQAGSSLWGNLGTFTVLRITTWRVAGPYSSPVLA